MSLRYLTAGESHGPALTVILDGLPAGIPITEASIRADLARRQMALGAGARMTIETDTAHILSGIMDGITTGAPVALSIVNADHAAWRGKAVAPYTVPRPGHADFAACTKYGYTDIRFALERASARETAARVAAGALCRAFLACFDITVTGRIVALGGVANPDDATRASLIADAQVAGETLGGIIEVTVNGVPPGLGSHTQNDRRLDAAIAAAVVSIPAIKGVEIGDAFANTAARGTHAHDALTLRDGTLAHASNRAGGIEGGISNGEPILVRAAMKPIPTTKTAQPSVDLATGEATQTHYERSDTCPVPRAVVVVEAALLLTLADALMTKLGGDSIAEMLPRHAALPRTAHFDNTPHVFWPASKE